MPEILSAQEVPWPSSAPAPCGLSCAYHLTLKGYKAVIFEAAAEPGGWLRYGIPAYRLPREVLDQEVNYIKQLGVEIHCNTPIGRGRTINDLLTRDGFRAVFLGVGCQDSSACRCPAPTPEGVLWGVEFLKDSAWAKKPPISRARKCIVVGGGNVAMDVARTARRQGRGRQPRSAWKPAKKCPPTPGKWRRPKHEGVRPATAGASSRSLARGRQGQRASRLRAVERVFDEAGRFSPTYFEDKTKTETADVVDPGHRPEDQPEVHHRGGRHQTHPPGPHRGRPGHPGHQPGGRLCRRRRGLRSLDRHRRGGRGPGSRRLHRPLSARPGPHGRPADLPAAPHPGRRRMDPSPGRVRPQKAPGPHAPHAGGRVAQGLQGNQPGLRQGAAVAEGRPLHQLRRVLRMYAVRHRLPGQGRVPRPGSQEDGAQRGRGGPGPGFSGLRPQQIFGISLCQIPQGGDQPGVRADPVGLRTLCRPPHPAQRPQGAQEDRLAPVRRLPGPQSLRQQLLLLGVLHVRHQAGGHRQGARQDLRTGRLHLLHGHAHHGEGI